MQLPKCHMKHYRTRLIFGTVVKSVLQALPGMVNAP